MSSGSIRTKRKAISLGVIEAISLVLGVLAALAAPFISAGWYQSVMGLGIAPFLLFTLGVFLIGLFTGSAVARYATRDTPGSMDDFSIPELERLLAAAGDGKSLSGALIRSTDRVEAALMSKGVYDVIERTQIQADPGSYSMRCSLKPEWRRWVIRNKRRIKKRVKRLGDK